MGILTGRNNVYNHNRKEYFNKPTIEYLRTFILDNGVSEADSIVLEPRVFDELALDYRQIFKEPIKVPFFYLGLWVKSAERSTVYPHEAVIIKDDPRPVPEPEKVSYQKEYRCGYCGKLVNEFGEELKGTAYQTAIARWKEYGDGIFTPTVGKCCEHREKR